jgi:hypothetical protein
MALEFLLVSPGFNCFLLLRDEQNSKCVGRVLVVKKCIYLSPTHLHLMQDIEDRCLLLIRSMSFVDLPFQEHRMMEKASYVPKSMDIFNMSKIRNSHR